MSAKVTWALAAALLTITAGVIAQTSGLPSRPRFQSVGIGEAAPTGTGSLALTGSITAGSLVVPTGSSTAATAFLRPTSDAQQYVLLGRSQAGPGIVGRWDSATTNRWLAFGLYDNLGNFTESFRADGITGGLTAASAAFTNLSVNGGAITYGTFTPTATGVTNVTTATPLQGQWMRVGSTVTVSGAVEITQTANGATAWELTLPVGSNFSSPLDGAGVGASSTGIAAGIQCQATLDRMSFSTNYSQPGIALTFRYTFTYQVI